MIAEKIEKTLNDCWEAIKRGEATPDRLQAAVNTSIRDLAKLVDVLLIEVAKLKKGGASAQANGAPAPTQEEQTVEGEAPAERPRPAGHPRQQVNGDAPSPQAPPGRRGKVRLSADGTPLSPQEQAEEEAMDQSIIAAGGQPAPATYVDG